MLQVCTQEKSEIEFVKSGLDMVVKKSADDHAKKIKEMEKRSEQAFDSKSIYEYTAGSPLYAGQKRAVHSLFIFVSPVHV